MDSLQDKYIDLILKKCIYSNSKNLFISYDKDNSDFIKKLIIKAKEYNYINILTDEIDIDLEHRLLEYLSIEDIKKHPYFCNDVWNQAIHDNCVFLIGSAIYPHFFDDIDSKKFLEVKELQNKKKAKYFESVMNDTISWTIFCLPNKYWASILFPDINNSYEKLEKLIYTFCMIDKNNPIDKWNQYIEVENKKVDYLNALNIKELVITNRIGTNLTISLADDYLFRTLDNNHCIENMPSYSFWTAPHKYKAEGIVYGSIPITSNNFYVEDYWFKLHEGKVVMYDAKIGKEYLDAFFKGGDSFKRLGEIAIIDFNSPIANTKTIYNTNLLDENIATHLALGSAYKNTLKNGTSMSDAELDEAGCNVCSKHLDFTIGTSDLSIIARTFDNKEIEIIKDGNFNYELINDISPFSI